MDFLKMERAPHGVVELRRADILQDTTAIVTTLSTTALPVVDYAETLGLTVVTPAVNYGAPFETYHNGIDGYPNLQSIYVNEVRLVQFDGSTTAHYVQEHSLDFKPTLPSRMYESCVKDIQVMLKTKEGIISRQTSFLIWEDNDWGDHVLVFTPEARRSGMTAEQMGSTVKDFHEYQRMTSTYKVSYDAMEYTWDHNLRMDFTNYADNRMRCRIPSRRTTHWHLRIDTAHAYSTSGDKIEAVSMEKLKPRYDTEKAAREALHKRLTLGRTLDVIGGSVVHCDDDLCQPRYIPSEDWYLYHRDAEVQGYGADANGNFWWLPEVSGWWRPEEVEWSDM